MKHLFIKNSTADNIGLRVIGTEESTIVNTGPEGAVVINGHNADMCFAPPTAIGGANTNVSDVITLDGEFVVQVGDEIVPYYFTAEDLGKYFNDADASGTGIVFVEQQVPQIEKWKMATGVMTAGNDTLLRVMHSVEAEGGNLTSKNFLIQKLGEINGFSWFDNLGIDLGTLTKPIKDVRCTSDLIGVLDEPIVTGVQNLHVFNSEGESINLYEYGRAVSHFNISTDSTYIAAVTNNKLSLIKYHLGHVTNATSVYIPDEFDDIDSVTISSDNTYVLVVTKKRGSDGPDYKFFICPFDGAGKLSLPLIPETPMIIASIVQSDPIFISSTNAKDFFVVANSTPYYFNISSDFTACTVTEGTDSTISLGYSTTFIDHPDGRAVFSCKPDPSAPNKTLVTYSKYNSNTKLLEYLNSGSLFIKPNINDRNGLKAISYDNSIETTTLNVRVSKGMYYDNFIFSYVDDVTSGVEYSGVIQDTDYISCGFGGHQVRLGPLANPADPVGIKIGGVVPPEASMLLGDLATFFSYHREYAIETAFVPDESNQMSILFTNHNDIGIPIELTFTGPSYMTIVPALNPSAEVVQDPTTGNTRVTFCLTPYVAP